jgi:hypothetical protein
MDDLGNDDYPDPTFRADAVYEAMGNCWCHSRRSEITIHNALWLLPRPVIEFFTKKSRCSGSGRIM